MADSPRVDEEISTGVCVVGAGPAGITLALNLDAAGVPTCLIESGGLDVEHRIQVQGRGEIAGRPLAPLDECRVRAFGGTLRHSRITGDGWAARPLDDIDFEPGPGTGSIGWPFGRSVLQPYYERAAATCGLRSQAQAEEWWTAHASKEALSLTEGRLAPAVFQFTRNPLTEAWPILSTSPSVRVLLHTRLVDLEVDPDGRVVRVVAVRGRREPVHIRPRVVVLAAGGIENARLLLTANGRRGLGNEHDLVGRYFAERLSFHAGHLEPAAGSVVPELDLLHRPPDHAVGGGLRVSESAQRLLGLTNCAFFLMPRPAAVTQPGLRALSTLRKSLARRPLVGVAGQAGRALTAGPALADLTVGRFGLPRPQTLLLRAQGEPTPDRESRVTLAAACDDLGVPLAKVTWRVHPGDLELIRASASLIGEAVRDRGLGRLVWSAEPERTLLEGNHHHLGATRMHRDPRHGVVDAAGRVHSLRNLYVTGSSVFPRYGAANPTLTIIALAHRLADHLIAEFTAGRPESRSETG